MTMTLGEIRARDLERAAYHEAGHVVVAGYVGVPAQAVVWSWPDGIDAIEMRTAAGKTFPLRPIPPEHVVMVGLAGEVAEMLLEDPAVDEWEILDHLELEAEGVSDTDRSMIGEVPTRSAVEQCLSVLRRNWSDVQREATDLVARWEEVEG